MLQQIKGIYKEMNIISDFGLFSKEIPTTYNYRNCLSAASWSQQKQCLYQSSRLYPFIIAWPSLLFFTPLSFISMLFFYLGIWDSLTRLETININCNPISSIPTRMFKKNPNFRRFVWTNMGSKCVKGIRTEIWICVIYHESSSTCSYLFIGEGILLPSSMFDSKNLETIEIR